MDSLFIFVLIVVLFLDKLDSIVADTRYNLHRINSLWKLLQIYLS